MSAFLAKDDSLFEMEDFIFQKEKNETAEPIDVNT